MTSIIIPSSVTSIGECVFSGCSGLTSITVESGNTVYDSRDNCNAIIETSTNQLVVGFKSTIIPGSVTSIAEYAFYHCCGLTSLTIPGSVTSIGRSAFSGCSGLTSITVESGNTVYDSRDNCNAIIETSTNQLVVGFKSTIIPSSVTSIGEYAFTNCSDLTSITIPSSVTSIGRFAFDGCTGLTSVTIGNGVTFIGDCAFSGCRGLQSVRIGNCVTSIGDCAFSGCVGLTSVYITDLAAWCNIKKSSPFDSTYHLYLNGKEMTNLVIPNSVTSIGEFAFSNCGLTSVSIPNSVRSIGSGAFSYCSDLKSVRIGNSVTSIGEGAFYHCSDLKTIHCLSKIPPSISYSFGERQYTTIYVYIPKGSLNAYKSKSGWKEFKNIVEE